MPTLGLADAARAVGLREWQVVSTQAHDGGTLLCDAYGLWHLITETGEVLVVNRDARWNRRVDIPAKDLDPVAVSVQDDEPEPPAAEPEPEPERVEPKVKAEPSDPDAPPERVPARKAGARRGR